MKNEQILKAFNDAFNDVDDAFIEEAAPGQTKVRRRSLPRVVMIAALVALLTVSAVAVGGNSDIIFGQKVISAQEHNLTMIYNDAGSDELCFTTVDIDHHLRPVTISERTYDALTKITTSRWEYLFQDDNYNTFYGSYEPEVLYYSEFNPTFSSLDEVEEYLGLELALTPEMCEASAEYLPAQMANVLTLCIGSVQRAEQEYRETGQVTPAGIEIKFYMTERSEYDSKGQSSSDNMVGSIFIALNEEYVVYRTPYSMDFYEKKGIPATEEYTFGEQKLTVLYTDPEPGWNSTAHAIYSNQGIGYMISVSDAKNDGDPVEMLMPLLENLE